MNSDAQAVTAQAYAGRGIHLEPTASGFDPMRVNPAAMQRTANLLMALHSLLAPTANRLESSSENPPEQEQFLHLQHFKDSQVSRLLCVSLDTVRRWRRKGVGPPYVKLAGGAVRYPVAELLHYLQNQSRG